MYDSIGKPIARVDAREKVTGQAVYSGDLLLRGCLWGRVLRSTYAHARIKNIDISKAESLPGVKAVVTGRDFAGYMFGESIKDMPLLAHEKVRYVGEPVAAVAAVDKWTAERAIDLISVEYEPLPGVFEITEAIKSDTQLIHPNFKEYKFASGTKYIPDSNICNHIQYIAGDVELGFKKSDLILAKEFFLPPVHHAAIEPHCATAKVDINGKIVIWSPNDAPHRLREEIAETLKISTTQIQVITGYMGGGFGGKGGLKAEAIALALAYKLKGKPVKVVFDRDEVFIGTLTRHGALIRIKTGVTKDGFITAQQVDSYWDTGAYAEKGPRVCLQGCSAALGPYQIPNAQVNGYCIYTNKPIAGAYRGYGTPQIAWAVESQMDILSETLKIDAVEFRRKNLLRENDVLPLTGQKAVSVGIGDCLEAALRETTELEYRNDGKLRGRGLACIIKNTKTPSESSAFVSLNRDGSCQVVTGTVEIGQGAKTILAQIAAEVLGASVQKIIVTHPDTDVAPFDSSTTSSRSTFHMGNAVKFAAEDIKNQLITLGSKFFDASPKNLALLDGHVVYGNEKINIAQLMKTNGLINLLGKGFFSTAQMGEGAWTQGSGVFWMYGVHIVDVAVDPETGKIQVERIIAAHDVGKAINPATVKQQIEGGTVMAAGITLYEELVLDREGRTVNANFHDYKITTAADAPEVIPIIVEKGHPLGPFGAKGLGEPVVTGISPAIGNALYQATGIRFFSLPITPERMKIALKSSKR